MFCLRWDNRSRRSRRLHCVVSWLLLAAIGGGVLGIPVFPVVASKDSERFPCEASRCGCATAGQCWDRCCCHSDEEKLAWAAANRVTPPAFLVQRVVAAAGATQAAAAAATSQPVASQLVASNAIGMTPPSSCCDTGRPSSSCCEAAGPSSSCCEAPAAQTAGDQACDDQLAGADSQQASDRAAGERRWRLISLVDVGQCQGLQMIWVLLSTAVVDWPCRLPAPTPPYLGNWVAADEARGSVAFPPDPPTPETARGDRSSGCWPIDCCV